MRALLFSFLCGLIPVLADQGAGPLRVVSFSTVLTEIAEQVGETHTKVTGLVLAGEEPHDYQPTPADLDQVSQANLVLLSGKHIEHYPDKVQQATGGKVDSLSVGDQLPSLRMKPDPEEEKAGASGEQTASEITRETGVRICGTLYADGLGTGPASTYDGMFRSNVSTIVDALR